MGNPLFAKKSMDMLLAEAKETGEHSLKRTLGPFQLTALGVGRGHRRWHFRVVRVGGSLRWAWLDAFLRTLWIGLRVCRALLRGVRGHDSAGGQRLYLRVRHARRVVRVDYRLGPDAGIRHGRQHGIFWLVEPLHRVAEYLSHQDAAVAGLRSLDRACRTAEKMVAQANGAGF